MEAGLIVGSLLAAKRQPSFEEDKARADEQGVEPGGRPPRSGDTEGLAGQDEEQDPPGGQQHEASKADHQGEGQGGPKQNDQAHLKGEAGHEEPGPCEVEPGRPPAEGDEAQVEEQGGQAE